MLYPLIKARSEQQSLNLKDGKQIKLLPYDDICEIPELFTSAQFGENSAGKENGCCNYLAHIENSPGLQDRIVDKLRQEKEGGGFVTEGPALLTPLADTNPSKIVKYESGKDRESDESLKASAKHMDNPELSEAKCFSQTFERKSLVKQGFDSKNPISGFNLNYFFSEQRMMSGNLLKAMKGVLQYKPRPPGDKKHLNFGLVSHHSLDTLTVIEFTRHCSSRLSRTFRYPPEVFLTKE